MNCKAVQIILLGWVLCLPVLARATKTTYLVTDRKFNFVKRVELKKKELKKRGEVSHPCTFNEFQLSQMLAPIRLNKKLVLSKKTEEMDVFEKSNLDWLVPPIVQAFKDAKPNEEVIFSFVTHSPKFLIRDDRLTIVRSWVTGGELHLVFRKLMAKLPNSYDKLSDVTEAMNRAQGLRVSLELQQGQQYGKTTDELVLAIPRTEKLAAAEIKPAPLSAVPAQSAPALQPVAAAPQKTVPDEGSVAERLKELQRLKDEGLITQKDYEKKKKDILRDL